MKEKFKKHAASLNGTHRRPDFNHEGKEYYFTSAQGLEGWVFRLEPETGKIIYSIDPRST